MSHKITLEALEVLDAIDRKGSFAAAAAALYRVPSAMTYTVRKLEADLGVSLFRKEGRRATMTPAGKVLLEQGRHLLLAADRLVETTRQVDQGWESRLNIGIDSILGFEVIFPHLQAFYAIKPDIEINVYEEVLGGAWESVIEGRVDVILGAPEPPANTQGLRLVELTKVAWDFVVAPGHALTELDRPLTAEDIRLHRAVVVRDSSRNLPPLTKRVFDRQAVLSVATMQQKIEAQAQGLGVGYLPHPCVEPYLNHGTLVRLEVEQDTPQTPLHLAWKTNSKGKALRWFVERLQAGRYF